MWLWRQLSQPLSVSARTSAPLPALPLLPCAVSHHAAPAPPPAQVRCGSAAESAPRELSARLFRHFFKAEPYAALRVGGWKVVALNSLLGHTWQWDHPHCNTRRAS